MIEDEPEPALTVRDCGHKANKQGGCFGKPSCPVGVKIKTALDAAKVTAKAAAKEAKQIEQEATSARMDENKAVRATRGRGQQYHIFSSV